ncbi:MAG: hypothetical protein KF805_17305, partial [Phycisphaeraceae bacterium]|nr:hypothetical protein [Phycisphaeraceae bacterium]
MLGKILFFDEQLSTTNFVSCATCHTPGSAGTDARPAHHPGPDAVLGTADDIQGSAGVVRSDGFNRFELSSVFGLRPQVTNRAANSPINSAFVPELFWDGRASTSFIDPQTGEIAIASGGTLESQCAMPPVSDVEMAHASMNWQSVTRKLSRIRALDLGVSLPPDVAAVLASTRSYRELFRRAFGDESITARRIAFAIATYERTLVADQTPWDAHDAGNTGALSAAQVQGLNFMNSVGCTSCHVPPHFTDHSFRNLGLRPNSEDLGRQIATANPQDRGKFKVPSLRNVGLKSTFEHNGQFQSLQQVLAFYAAARTIQPAPDNRDPLLDALQIPPEPAATRIVDFLQNGLTDPRVAAQQFPFDKPTLLTERFADLPQNVGGGLAGSGGIPRIIVESPPMVGNREFRVGLDGAPPGAAARLGISTSGPKLGRITPQSFFPFVNVGGSGVTSGVATLFWPLLAGKVTPGQTVYVQWFVDDAIAPGGQSLSQIVKLTFFCGSSGCPSACSMSDLNGDGLVDDSDFQIFVGAYQELVVPIADVLADLNADGLVDD